MVLMLTSPNSSARSAVRIALVMFWGFFLAVYIAAKFDFFVHYDPLRVGTYLQEHSKYWVGMAALVAKWNVRLGCPLMPENFAVVCANRDREQIFMVRKHGWALLP